MEQKSTLLTDLIQIIESYMKTNLEILKLKAISRSSDVVSSIMLKLIVFIFVSIMIFLINIGLALWIGQLLGELSLGFFAVAAFYVLVAMLLILFPNIIKSPFRNAIILKMLNKNKDEKNLS